MTIRVIGAKTDEDAKTTARAIANSPLVKTAVHGGDPNWGRLVAVAGRATRTLVLDRARVRVGPVELFANGAPYDERAPEAAEYLQGKDIAIEVDLGTGGSGEARMWSCDLTAEYVRINAEYRTYDVQLPVLEDRATATGASTCRRDVARDPWHRPSRARRRRRTSACRAQRSKRSTWQRRHVSSRFATSTRRSSRPVSGWPPS